MPAKTEARKNATKVARLLKNGVHAWEDLYETQTFGTASGTLRADRRVARIVLLEENRSQYEFMVIKMDGPEWTHGRIGYVYSSGDGRWAALIDRTDLGPEFAGFHDTVLAACKALL